MTDYDFSETIYHQVGGQLFDSDCGIVENFVRVNQGMASSTEVMTLKLYYVGALMRYKDKILREYTSDVKTIDYFAQGTKIISETFNIDAVQTLFDQMSKVMCGKKINLTPLEVDKVKYTNSKLYLPNDTGLFGLNSYLFAFFHGIYIIGVPSMIQHYDQQEGCPWKFIKHDYFHMTDNEEGKDFCIEFTDLYFALINSLHGKENRSVELALLVMWVTIHEADLGVWDFIETQGNPFSNYGQEWVHYLAPSIFYEFFSEFQAYQDLYLTREIFESVEPSTNPDPRYFDSIKSFNQLKEILSSDAPIQIKSKILMVMAAEYTRKYVQENFKDEVAIFEPATEFE